MGATHETSRVLGRVSPLVLASLLACSGSEPAGAPHGDGGASGDAGGEISDASSSDASASGNNNKKGVGVGATGRAGEAQLRALGVHWYYDWGTDPVSGIDFPFVPLIFSPSDVGMSVTGPLVLGFNEPDNASQANISVDAALAAWPEVVAKAPTVGAPAMAGNPVTGAWFPAFMDAGPEVNFIPIHWYKGANSALFISDVTAVIDAYHLPVWVTELAPQTNAESESNPTQYSQAEVNQFITETVAWMEQEPEVQRYAWHDATTGTSSLYEADGGLSETGLTYANAN